MAGVCLECGESPRGCLCRFHKEDCGFFGRSACTCGLNRSINEIYRHANARNREFERAASTTGRAELNDIGEWPVCQDRRDAVMALAKENADLKEEIEDRRAQLSAEHKEVQDLKARMASIVEITKGWLAPESAKQEVQEILDRNRTPSRRLLLRWYDCDMTLREAIAVRDGDRFKAYASPGTLVRLDTGEELLVGDLNDAGGRCGCCAPDLDSKVVAFAPAVEMPK